MFVRGKDNDARNEHTQDSNEVELQETVNENDSNSDVTDSDVILTKEGRVAKLYRELVYRPFIDCIRKEDYGWDGNGEVPEYLQAVSWQDGAIGQIKCLTSRSSLDEDKNH